MKHRKRHSFLKKKNDKIRCCTSSIGLSLSYLSRTVLSTQASTLFHFVYSLGWNTRTVHYGIDQNIYFIDYQGLVTNDRINHLQTTCSLNNKRDCYARAVYFLGGGAVRENPACHLPATFLRIFLNASHLCHLTCDQPVKESSVIRNCGESVAQKDENPTCYKQPTPSV